MMPKHKYSGLLSGQISDLIPNTRHEKSSPIRAFLSHSSKDRRMAGSISDSLREYDINVFVAHDDIDGGDIWFRELFDKLKDCDIFMCLLTDNFHHAEYTEQEVGMAYAFKKKILPISVDHVPHGFIRKFQAIKFDPRQDNINQLVRVVYKQANNGHGHEIDMLIRQFSKSKSHGDANFWALEISKHLNNLTIQHKDRLNAVMNGEGYAAESTIAKKKSDEWFKGTYYVSSLEMNIHQIRAAIIEWVGSDYSNWYIGITDDPDTRRQQHTNTSRWKAWPANSENDAREIEREFLNKGMRGDTGGGYTPNWVYVY